MKTRSMMIVVLGFMIVAGFLTMACSSRDSKPAEPAVSKAPAHHKSQPSVPRYMAAVDARDLPATLAPAQFIGKAREAYEVAKRIPATLAQLPCYCHCDQSFGHKSLHTCFVDNHASQCAVCVDEALLAYRLEKEQRLTPEQIRNAIIEKYSREQ